MNEAFRILKNPVARAKHLLELQGVDVAFETNTAMPPEFLIRQMELREALEEATGRKDSRSLDMLRSDLRREEAVLEKQIADAIDGRKDFQAAAGLVRKLMFLTRLDEEIDLAYEATD